MEQIRPATAQDIPVIHMVRQSAWRDTYTGLVPDGYLNAVLDYSIGSRTCRAMA